MHNWKQQMLFITFYTTDCYIFCINFPAYC